MKKRRAEEDAAFRAAVFADTTHNKKAVRDKPEPLMSFW